MATPQITVAGSAADLFGSAEAGTLTVQLCGFNQIPRVPTGPKIIAETAPQPITMTGGTYSFLLWGNDVIVPAGTFYTIWVKDANGNTVQMNAYQFTGTETVDLATAAPYNPPQPGAFVLAYLPSASTVPGTVFVAPGAIVMAFVAGVPQRPTLDFSGVGTMSATFTFTVTDPVYFLCYVPTATATIGYLPCTGSVPGNTFAAPGNVIMVFVDGVPQRPTLDFSGVGTTLITFTFTVTGEVYALVTV